jgi:hypothetical protein
MLFAFLIMNVKVVDSSSASSTRNGAFMNFAGAVDEFRRCCCESMWGVTDTGGAADDADVKQSVSGVQRRLAQAQTALFAVLRAVGRDFALSRQAVGFVWVVRALQVGPRRAVGSALCALASLSEITCDRA